MINNLYRGKREDCNEYFEGNYSFIENTNEHIITCLKGKISFFVKPETLQKKENINAEWKNVHL